MRPLPGGEARLGSAAWAGASGPAAATLSLWYSEPGFAPVGFAFEDRIRADAAAVAETLHAAGYGIEVLSGDRNDAVAQAAQNAGIPRWQGNVGPDRKLARIADLTKRGHRILMVGDGLNDAPALAAGHASMSPATAVDISQTAADAVFQSEKLAPVVETLKVARASRILSLQNIAIAVIYNLFFVPLAMAGYVTPLLAAIAMSTSSIAVTANAVRLRAVTLLLPPPLGSKGARR